MRAGTTPRWLARVLWRLFSCREDRPFAEFWDDYLRWRAAK